MAITLGLKIYQALHLEDIKWNVVDIIKDLIFSSSMLSASYEHKLDISHGAKDSYNCYINNRNFNNNKIIIINV